VRRYAEGKGVLSISLLASGKLIGWPGEKTLAR
jgi:hypothetical protein